jgi:hypothetical protein
MSTAQDQGQGHWLSGLPSDVGRAKVHPYEHGRKSASKIGSSTSFRDAWTTRSRAVGTVASYCGPFRLCGLGFDVVREFVGVGDASVAVGLDLVAVVDLESPTDSGLRDFASVYAASC